MLLRVLGRGTLSLRHAVCFIEAYYFVRICHLLVSQRAGRRRKSFYIVRSTYTDGTTYGAEFIRSHAEVLTCRPKQIPAVIWQIRLIDVHSMADRRRHSGFTEAH